MIKYGGKSIKNWIKYYQQYFLTPCAINWPQLSFLKNLILGYTTILLTSVAPYQKREGKQLNENHEWTKHYKLYDNRKKNAKQLEKHC